jgi:hypothetical protein
MWKKIKEFETGISEWNSPSNVVYFHGRSMYYFKTTPVKDSE